MRTFDTGATRNDDAGKLEYHKYLSSGVLRRYAEYMLTKQINPDGTKRAGDNWKKGIGTPSYMDSLDRHFHDVWMFLEGRFTPDSVAEEGMSLETALCALLFNAMGLLDNLLIDRGATEQAKANPAIPDRVKPVDERDTPLCEIPHATIEEEDLCEKRRLAGKAVEDADGAVTVQTDQTVPRQLYDLSDDELHNLFRNDVASVLSIQRILRSRGYVVDYL